MSYVSRRRFRYIFSLAATLLTPSINLGAQSTPILTVNAAANEHAIDPNIYGIASYGLDQAFAAEIKVPNVRWGGDGASRYNWEEDSTNSGADWYFMGGDGVADAVPGASADAMIEEFKPAGANALLTIPIIPYVNKTSAWNCSYPLSKYPGQSYTNPYIFPNGQKCGDGYVNGTPLKDTNIGENNIANTTGLQQRWVEHLVAKHGTAAKGGVPFYQLDNEPYGWNAIHFDIQPTTPEYSQIVALGEKYAAAVKQVDPSASVLGPSDFTLGGWVGAPASQNNLLAGQYYLQQMAAYEKAHGTRLLDYFDEHYYPQFSNVATQLASTRTLWDPTYNGGTWVEKWFFKGPMQLIPRFHQWIDEYYPGTKLSFSEYSIDSGKKLVTDGIAEADVLGIFGREGVDFANMWNTPAPTDPTAYAFRLYRDYDGAGGEFGNLSVSAASSNQEELSIYGAVRSSDGALTLVVLNKTPASITTKLTLQNFKAGSSVKAYRYGGASGNSIEDLGSVSLSANTLSYDYPGYSAVVFVVAKAK